MAKFEVTLHEVWDKRFTRTVDAGSAEEAALIASDIDNVNPENDWKLVYEDLSRLHDSEYTAKAAVAGK